MEIKVKKPSAVKLFLDEQNLVIQQTVKSGLRRNLVTTNIPRTTMIGMEMHKPTAATNGHLQLTYKMTKEAPEQNIEFWFMATDEPFILTLQQILEQQIDKNSAWGEDDFVANGQLIMDYLAMRDQGLLTDEEFEAKKREILRLD
ncbi:SHOCT domain-containing protein [Loigolactobacillus binensis]|uniref:SHOCT domain-containing protein n=1 Tax=Loigolactobacillus binensis TaxID=2559922 RepID=A0ABW3EBX1_9LACO|nr:SHOCT domain-containing protein [Loigolactobacillus binensis]